jgi:hypothetical protein
MYTLLGAAGLKGSCKLVLTNSFGLWCPIDLTQKPYARPIQAREYLSNEGAAERPGIARCDTGRNG